MKKFISILLVLSMVFGMSTSAFAMAHEENGVETEREYTLAEAKEYLLNYCKIETNEFGKELKTTYEFDSDADLERAAAYIVDYGLDAFNKKLEADIKEYVKKEEQIIMPRETSPMSINKTISGNGTHAISGETYGLASFKTLGTVEYRAIIKYSVVVKNGKIVRFGTSPTFDIPTISGGGSWGKVTIKQDLKDYTANAAASYVITKSVKIKGVTVKSETDTEVFGVAALLK